MTEDGEPRFLLGIDEAGTGAWAGPFCIGGTIYPLDFELKEVLAKKGSVRRYRDSKKLTKALRESVREKIETSALAHDVAFVYPEDIKKRGQGVAWQDGIIDVVKNLLELVGERGIVYGRVDIMVDGSTNHALTNRVQAEVQSGIRLYYGAKADEAKFAVCAASILAKTSRDDYMHELHQRFPEYKFNTNVGYGTEEHAEALVLHGRRKFHRPCTHKWDLADR